MALQFELYESVQNMLWNSDKFDNNQGNGNINMNNNNEVVCQWTFSLIKSYNFRESGVCFKIPQCRESFYEIKLFDKFKDGWQTCLPCFC